VQARAGVADAAQRVGRSIGSRLDDRNAEFLASQRLALLAGADAAGSLWASPVFGEPGFARAVGDDTLELASEIPPDDPLADALRPGAPVGALVIDLETRRRLRANGVVSWRLPRSLAIGLREVFWNCPRYIQRRELAASALHEEAPTDVRAWIESADTLFVASHHVERGADASHRGGAPGFVRMLGPNRLELPDYPGNTMFQTLGNLTLDPRIGLAFPDFERGRVLQLSGTARIDWDPARAALFPGAERVVEVSVERSVERALPGAPRWRTVEPSPHNPPAPAATMRRL
jgi:predicted pyridoxine 5'-phosphate oxidase superfamily flavin-nucleotide-binding protein